MGATSGRLEISDKLFVRDILDILAQCNKSKPTLTCISSLGI